VADVTTRKYHSSRRDSAAAETRAAVLAAALHLFEARGYSLTTIGEIAARAEISTATVYSSVGGKPQLLIELIRTASSNELIDNAMQEVANAKSAMDVLNALSSGTQAVFESRSWLLGALYDNAASDPLIAEAIAVAEQTYTERIDLCALRIVELSGIGGGLNLSTVSDILWFYFGFRSWRDLRNRGWTWDRINPWLVSQAAAAAASAE
jgi:AcrR family transcriptional regulator